MVPLASHGCRYQESGRDHLSTVPLKADTASGSPPSAIGEKIGTFQPADVDMTLDAALRDLIREAIREELRPFREDLRAVSDALRRSASGSDARECLFLTVEELATTLPLLEGDTNLAVDLEPADPRAVPGARIDHDEGAPGRVGGRVVGAWLDAKQGVIRRLGQRARVQDRLVVEDEDRRLPRLRVIEGLVAPVAQDVPGQYHALPSIDQVLGGGIDGDGRIFLHISNLAAPEGNATEGAG
jgi:hypothetical protein